MRLIDADNIKYVEYINGGITVSKEVIEQQPIVEPNQWIPCSERLPEESKTYLICLKSENSIFEPIIKTARYGAKENKWKAPDAYSFYESVIAWQPLPQPYTENRKEL